MSFQPFNNLGWGLVFTISLQLPDPLTASWLVLEPRGARDRCLSEVVR